MNLLSLLLLPLLLGSFVISEAFSQTGSGDSPFERKFGDVKYLDSYFGTINEKIEVNPGDDNVPFTVVFANVGTQDITGIRGQLSLPLGFSAASGSNSVISADAETNSLAGQNFHLTFFVTVGEHVKIGQFPATVKVDYSRLRESGERNAFFEFQSKVTGDSIINMRALEPFLTSLTQNHVVIEISNDGTAPVSAVDIELTNTQSEIASTSQSITNIENVVILNTNWDVGQINPGDKKYLEASIYVPKNLKGDTLRAPMTITFYNAQGDKTQIFRIVDFFIKGLIDVTIYNVDVINLSEQQTIIGEIINEGNEDAVFGFVTIEPLGESNIKKKTQFIDEIEIDSPVPFNVPIEFDGEPKYGEHEIRVTLRYKDDTREEHFLNHDAIIFLSPTVNNNENPDALQFIIVPIIAVIAIFFYFKRKKKQQSKIETS